MASTEIYREDITQRREDMNFMSEWQEQYLTRSLRPLVRYCSCHENIKFISELTCNVLFRHTDDDVLDDFPKICGDSPNLV